MAIKNHRRVQYLRVNTDMLSKNSARRLRRELQKIYPPGEVISMVLLRGYIVTLGLKVLEDCSEPGTGQIPKFEWHKEDIADTLSWRGDPELLFRALVRSGWLVVTKDYWIFPQIREASEYWGGGISRVREREREAYREKKGGKAKAKPKAAAKKAAPKPSKPKKPRRIMLEPVVEEKKVYNPDTLRLVPVVIKEDSNDQVQNVVSFYRLKFPNRGRQLKPGHRDWKIIMARIREGYSVDELRKAVIGNSICNWHSERKLHGVVDVFRNADKVAKFIAIAEGGITPAPMSKMERETVQFLELERNVDKTIDGGVL